MTAETALKWLLVLCTCILQAYGQDEGAILDVNLTEGAILDVNLTPEEVQNAVEEAVEIVREQIEVMEPLVFQNGGKLGPDSVAYHYYSLRAGNEDTRTIAAVAQISQTATLILVDRHNLTVGQVSLVLPQIDTMSTMLADSCPTPLPLSSCPPSRYRTLDGTCNNPNQPRWGAANTPYLRLLPAWYDDGVSSPRVSRSGTALPAASLVSKSAHSGNVISHAHVSLLATVWAEYLSHDLAQPIVAEGVRGERLKCCGVLDIHSECFPITDEAGSCWEYARALPATTTDCALGVREQLNGATSFLDGSAIYGSSEKDSDRLRLFEKGHLKTQADWLLPRANSHTCKDAKMCFLGGDLRLNTHGGVAALQTLLVHEHNRIASLLSELNSQWGDETLFEETRTIISAKLQHITYKEFLPTFLGRQVVFENELIPLSSGFYDGYDITIEPGVFNSVATAVMQLVLTLLPDNLPLTHSEIPLAQTALNMSILYKPGIYEQIIQGLVNGNSLTFDPAVSESVRGYLGGLDLFARTVQSGRDHGLPPYVVWRPLCGRRPAHSFDDLSDVMNEGQISSLRSLFNDVADVDIISGVVSERPLEGALVGPTAACLLALQFKVLRQTDRHWYENDLPPSAFSKEQLHEIRKTSISRLICDNIPGLSEVPKSAFLAKDSFLNAPVPCRDLDYMDVSAWKSKAKLLVEQEILKNVVAKGKVVVEKRRKMEKHSFEKGLKEGSKSAAGSAHSRKKPDPTSLIMANTSVLLEAISHELVAIVHERRVRRQIQGQGKSHEFDFNLLSVDISELVPSAPLIRAHREADEDRACDPKNPFRIISGHCNNLRRPEFGRSNVVFNRLIPADYEDGISAPRTRSSNGRPLPSPRQISTSIHKDINHQHQLYTLMLMQVGQFLDHDITFTPLSVGFQDHTLACKDCESQQREDPECWPISVPDNDPFYPPVNISSGRQFCIAFTRSLHAQQTLGPREQMNQITAFVDASSIYSHIISEAKELRTLSGGRLKVKTHPIQGKPLLPQVTDFHECMAPSGRCFKAGDARSSEQAMLAVMHTIWMREHNRIVDGLRRVNRDWNDERLYQEGRRIVTAMWQHIVYNEFLPRVLGWNAMQFYSLRLKTDGYYNEYDGNCKPDIYNEFATAAFRFGHSLVSGSYKRLHSQFGSAGPDVLLRHTFFNPDMLLEVQMIDELVRGLVSTPVQNLDNFMTEDITNHLFEEPHIPFSGLDLVAINIQRAREHGIRSYNEYRVFCNLRRARTFQDLAREIKYELIENLKKVYTSVDDIDLFTGGLSETPLQGGIIGPTFGCIIGQQFSLLRKCDRFWYETGDASLRFSERQLANIREVTMASLICDNLDVVNRIQRDVFDMPHEFSNPRVPCATVPSINFELWHDTATCKIGGSVVQVGEVRTTSPCTLCHCTNSGAQCNTLKVNCFELRSSFGLEEILRDDVCRAQCGNILDSNSSHQPPPAPHPQPPSIPQTPFRPPQALQNHRNPIPQFLKNLFG